MRYATDQPSASRRACVSARARALRWRGGAQGRPLLLTVVAMFFVTVPRARACEARAGRRGRSVVVTRRGPTILSLFHTRTDGVVCCIVTAARARSRGVDRRRQSSLA